jgi:hypothetical protein
VRGLRDKIVSYVIWVLNNKDKNNGNILIDFVEGDKQASSLYYGS